MSSKTIISVDKVSKYYHIYDKPLDRLKQSLYRGRKQFFREFKALDDISFEVKQGETVGIIGRNGSGKSTLLQMVCGTLTPTYGEINVVGRVAALLELGAGFNPDFTGRENIYMNATILGLNKSEIDEKYNEIVEFSGIADFIDQPVKTYSSGMFVRLAFSVAINVDPDVLIVDEALSVGDMNFQAKCMTALTRIQEKGATVLFVSHDINSVKSLCSRGVYLEDGHVKMIGPAGDVAETYVRHMREEMNADIASSASTVSNVINTSTGDAEAIVVGTEMYKHSESFDARVKTFRYGQGGVKVDYVELLDGDGAELSEVEFGQQVEIKIYFGSTIETLLGPCYYIMDDKRNLILGAGPRQLNQPYLEVVGDKRYIVSFKTKLPLKEGSYSIQVQLNKPVVEGMTAEYLDVIDDAVLFKVGRRNPGCIWTNVYIDNEMEVVTL